MDVPGKLWHFPAMARIPIWQLYGEASPFPDFLHIERIADRAAGMDWRIAPHRHLSLHQVFLVREGAITVTLDGCTLTPEPPFALNIPHGSVHGFAFSAGTEGHVLSLPVADFPELFGPDAVTIALARPFSVPGQTLAAPIDRLADEHRRSGPLRRLRLRAAAVDLCCGLVDLAEQAGGQPCDPRISRFEAQVRERLTENWQVADHARALGLSDRQLRRLCQQATGVSAHAFIDLIRLREACRLLAYTRMQVQEVGYALGFEDPAYFARVFRRGSGRSPGEYRRGLV